MPSAKEVFEFTIERANHFIRLYDILHNIRQRGGRSDWSRDFKKLMHWPQNDKITRIDGKDQHSILVLREPSNLDQRHFCKEYTDELLRSAIVTAVSAMDKYVHDLIVENSWKLLTQSPDKIPDKLAKFEVPLIGTIDAVTRVRLDKSARPGSKIKGYIQEALHQLTFQNDSSFDLASKLLGINEFWRKLSKEVKDQSNCQDLKKELHALVKRRNQIVHEGDVIRKVKSKKVSLNSISRSEAENYVEWVKKFVMALDVVFKKEFKK